MLARFGKQPIVNVVNFPKNLRDLRVIIDALRQPDTGLTDSDAELFASKIWRLISSCYKRRQEIYERISWWEYMEADRQCIGRPDCAYQTYFVGGLTHTLVAAQPKLMSTKTGGDVLLQLIFLMLNPEAHTDRVLNGPTNEAWLFPWLKYLRSKGVTYHHNHRVTSISYDAKTNRIQHALVRDETTGQERTVTADYFISALPVEVMAPLVTPEMVKADSTLGYLAPLSKSTNWMTGVQYFLNQEADINRGHIIFMDSPWALTGLSQVQFWKNFDPAQYGNGEMKSILSVDISDWNSPGLNGKTAKNCTREEVIDEVWNQLEKSLNIGGKTAIDRSMRVDAYLDRDIVEDPNQSGGFLTRNEEPLLVNQVNTWSLRPEVHSLIPNLFLASDYVRTNTDLATMEGANEAARRAVNCILRASGHRGKYCKIWRLHEPGVLWVVRAMDRIRYERGLPWSGKLPRIAGLMHQINHLTSRILKY